MERRSSINRLGSCKRLLYFFCLKICRRSD
nr:MAG TPA: hypothetical protein [Caudoviricetes sp.]